MSEQAQGAPPAEERTFTTQTEVARYLDAQGFRASVSTVNAHVKKRLLVANEQGVYTLAAVEAYTRAAKLKRKDGGDAIMDSITARKARADAERSEEQARRIRHENDIKQGLYMLKAQRDTDLADRSRALRTNLFNFFRANIDEFIALVHGDPDIAPQAVEWWEGHLEDWLNVFAATRKISPEQKA